MFTVCVKRPDRNEDLYEAREVRKEPTGLLLQTRDTTIFIGAKGQEMSLDSDCRKKDRDSEPRSDLDYAQVYVMNAYGSTVAQYTI